MSDWTFYETKDGELIRPGAWRRFAGQEAPTHVVAADSASLLKAIAETEEHFDRANPAEVA